MWTKQRCALLPLQFFLLEVDLKKRKFTLTSPCNKYAPPPIVFAKICDDMMWMRMMMMMAENQRTRKKTRWIMVVQRIFLAVMMFVFDDSVMVVLTSSFISTSQCFIRLITYISYQSNEYYEGYFLCFFTCICVWISLIFI